MTPTPDGGSRRLRAINISPRWRPGLEWTATISRRFFRTWAVSRRRTLASWHEETGLDHLASLPGFHHRFGSAEQRPLQVRDVPAFRRQPFGDARQAIRGSVA